MPQSRRSLKKFNKIIGMLYEEKKQAITALGFGDYCCHHVERSSLICVVGSSLVVMFRTIVWC